MFFKRNLLKMLVVIPMILIYRPFLFFDRITNDNTVFGTFLSEIFGGSYDRNTSNFSLSVESLMQIVLFNLFFGMYLYKDLHQCSEYIFTREITRNQWFKKRCTQLFFYSTVYTFIYISLFGIASCLATSKPIDSESVLIIGMTYIILCLFTYVTTFLINLVSIFKGSSIGFFVIYIGIIFFTHLAIIFEQIPVLGMFDALLYLNPMVHVIVSWDYSSASMWGGLLYYIVFSIIITLVGMKMINQIDIGIKGVEHKG